MAKLKRKREDDFPETSDPYGVHLPICPKEAHRSMQTTTTTGKKRGPRPATNCNENPNCIFGLGEYMEGIWKTHPAVLDALGDNPSLAVRTRVTADGPSTPCGLRNLGATCYVNSMVQVLFMDLAFRRAVHEWKPNDRSHVDVGRLGQMQALQRLFASMQFSAKSFADPQAFSGTLSLNEDIQQDAHEFTKLLLTHLESIFAFSSDERQRSFINEHFRGRMQNVTTCLRCNMASNRTEAFSDLSLGIRGHATVRDSLEAFLAPELLEGDNMYFCGHCQSKQRATRQIQLDYNALPPTLSLHFMRFVYDVRLQAKKKVQDAIAMSETLVLGPHEYKLTAVLNHKGTTAHAGHYTATVFSPDVGQWCCFNDVDVSLVDASAVVGPSKEAYMLIYSRVMTPVAPADAIPFAIDVETSNAQFAREQDAWKAEAKAIQSKIDERKKMYRRSFEAFAPVPNADAEAYAWVATDYIRHWVQGADIGLSSEVGFAFDAAASLCEHGKLQPALARLHYKRVSPRVVSALAPPPEAVVSSATFGCNDCMEAWKTTTLQLHNDTQGVLDQLSQLQATDQDGVAYVMSRKWINAWKICVQHGVKKVKTKPEKLDEAETILKSPINADIVCPHGALRPNTRKQWRTISPVSWAYFSRENMVALELEATGGECDECAAVASTLEEYHAQAQTTRDEVLRANPMLKTLYKRRLAHPFDDAMDEMSCDVPYVVLPRPWLQQWRKYFDDMNVDEPPPLDLAAFQCAHGKYLVPHNIKHVMLPTSVPATRHTTENDGELVTVDEWMRLFALYGGVDTPFVTLKTDHAVVYGTLQSMAGDDVEMDFVHRVELCSVCEAARDDEHRNFQMGVVHVEVLGPDDPVPSKAPNASASLSKRRRSNRKSRKQRDTLHVECNADDTVLLFKHKILEHCDIDPNHQVLYFKGVLLENDSSLKAAGVEVHDTVFMQALDGELSDADAILVTGPTTEQEQGFRSTAFHAGPSTAAVQLVWVCAQCTFVNDADLVACEVCDAPQE
ncbi:hypothetical protein SPRG_12059 [Saprolegnia parasitica CBS 223.65]|uniref:ubiquitinyl hydrolase 1 n=1 Tax=Saprolegnia parasitica (strain CBS 223.65) TaxID=695850 RepID=A0A067C5J2_SAPPC|nr:hypothetical protein SPRG_12059 [Saprolegnia parasitica CBS 223.65]KDO22072.1 hypothetical protein SPRG_12059 [Saprolegnia parasitica CBS 223.65]|eukprot:XP_012207215.1 hypothetical protein SPRG_12059 [Saprolegnia parasitica CBS 223.65]